MSRPGEFFCVDNRIFECGLKPRDIAVYCCLCRHINSKTGVAFPSRRKIAGECGIAKAETVDRALERLASLGLIEKHRQYMSSGGCGANIYTLSDFGDMGSPYHRDSNYKNRTNIITDRRGVIKKNGESLQES